MIILDTNVVSELISQRCSASVLAWIDSQSRMPVFVTAISLSELLLGIELLPPGKRKQGLAVVVESFLEQIGKDRVLDFDEASARAYASIMSQSRSNGLAISISDGQIAAIAKVHGFTVATRDTSPFEAAGVAFVNPWEEQP